MKETKTEEEPISVLVAPPSGTGYVTLVNEFHLSGFPLRITVFLARSQGVAR